MDRVRLPAGKVVGCKYLIEAMVGSGGMGEVYRARHLLLSEHVALKLPVMDPEQSATAVVRLLREARAASRLQSVHAVRVRDVDTLEGGTPYVVMDYLTGRDLARVLREEGAVAVDLALDWVLQACEALAEAHAMGIVHRDIKPSNLFLAETPTAPPMIKVLDFGVARAVSILQDDPLGGDLTRSGQVLGSPRYMAPEQIRNAEQVGPPADVWSLAVVLFELITGHLPFSGETSPAVLAAVSADEPLRLRALCPDLPAELDAVLASCMRKCPRERPPSMAVFAQALAPFLVGGFELAERVRAGALRGEQMATAPVETSPHSISDLVTVDPVPSASEHTLSTWGDGPDDAEDATRGRKRRAGSLALALAVVVVAAALSAVVLPGTAPSVALGRGLAQVELPPLVQSPSATRPSATAANEPKASSTVERVMRSRTRRAVPGASPSTTTPAPDGTAAPASTAEPPLAPTNGRGTRFDPTADTRL